MHSAGPGRPSFIIPKEIIELLRSSGFYSWTEISRMFLVSGWTLYRRAREYNLQDLGRYSTITDEELDSLIRGYISRHRNTTGESYIIGYIRPLKLKVQRARVRESLTRVDLRNTELRWACVVTCRVYSVPGPNSLWHIDGHHSLIRSKLVVHGCIDGFSRRVMYLFCANNNYASTVLTVFQNAAPEFGCHNDVWRLHHPDANEYTWYRLNSRQASRLDMFWLCSFLLPFIMSVEILPFFRSDHRYVYLKLAIPNSVHRGPGLWKFNTSHLKDLSFILMVTCFWESWQTERATFFSLSAWWDAGKIRLRRKICSFSRRTACEFCKRASSLERTLYFLTRQVDSGEDVQSLINDSKTELQQLHCQQAHGCRIRANIQLAEEWVASTAYFFNLEKKQGQARLFTAITTVSGVIVKSFSLTAQAWILFYTTLFTAQSLLRSEQDFFLSHLTRFLTFAERRSCEGLLTNEECKAALDQMPTGKSPGLDGLPAEFFKTF